WGGVQKVGIPSAVGGTGGQLWGNKTVRDRPRGTFRCSAQTRAARPKAQNGRVRARRRDGLKIGWPDRVRCRPHAVLRCYSMEIGRRRALPAVRPAWRVDEKERV